MPNKKEAVPAKLWNRKPTGSNIYQGGDVWLDRHGREWVAVRNRGRRLPRHLPPSCYAVRWKLARPGDVRLPVLFHGQREADGNWIATRALHISAAESSFPWPRVPKVETE